MHASGLVLKYEIHIVRADANLVRYFASEVYPKDSNKHMEWYKKYKHSAFVRGVMNEKGIDVMQVGWACLKSIL